MLSKDEIRVRMIELRNLRTLHAAQKVRIGKLEGQVRILKRENAELRGENALLKHDVQDLKLQMEELKTIVFGRKRKKDRSDDEAPPPSPRSAQSYRRRG